MVIPNYMTICYATLTFVYDVGFRSKRCKREIAKQKSFDAQIPFVGAAVGIVVSTLAVVWDFVIFGHESLIASPILKG